MGNFSDKSVEKSNHIFYVQYFPLPPENRAVYEIMWKHGTAGQTTDNRMHVHGCLPDATSTHSEHVTLLLFNRNSSCTNAPQLCFIRPVPVLLS